MPIVLPFSFEELDQERFREVDYGVMRHVFECQNDLGRFCEESIYRNDLAARLRAAGIEVVEEVPVQVGHRNFVKTYWLDLVAGQAAVYELKAASAFAPEHEAQLLSYLFLCGLPHGKLVNFRGGKVEARFVNTSFKQADRRVFVVETGGWQERDERDSQFRESVIELVKDWGWGLDFSLYSEALVHFAGGEEAVSRRLPLKRGERVLGTQLFHLLDAETGFRVTTFNEECDVVGEQLRRMLRLSPLKRLLWANICRKTVTFSTLVP